MFKKGDIIYYKGWPNLLYEYLEGNQLRQTWDSNICFLVGGFNGWEVYKPAMSRTNKPSWF